jgi:ABC-type nitrate/sulfonate/bicarbonate transport system substrate-binding protein
MSRSFGLTFAFVMAVALACGEAAAQAKKKLTVANGADVAFLHYFAAVKKGFFEKNGIQVDSKLFDDGVTALDSLLTGNADISAASEMAGVVRRARGGKLYVVATGAQSKNQIGMVVKENFKQPKDLEGKKVGVVIGSGSHYFFDRYAKKYNVDQRKLTVVKVQPPEMVAALLRNDIDVAYIWNPWPARALSTIPGTRVYARNGDDGVYFLHIYVYFSQRMMDDPQLAIASLKALSEGADWIRNPANLEEAAKISSQAINIPIQDARNYVQNVFNWEVFYSPDLKKNFEDVAAFAKEINVIKEAPKMDEMIRPEFMQKAYPEKANRKL